MPIPKRTQLYQIVLREVAETGKQTAQCIRIRIGEYGRLPIREYQDACEKGYAIFIKTGGLK